MEFSASVLLCRPQANRRNVRGPRNRFSLCYEAHGLSVYMNTMTSMRIKAFASLLLLIPILASPPLLGQQGTTDGDWRVYGGDAGGTKYSPLDEINAENVAELEIVWRWKANNFGPRPDYNWQATPLAIDGVLYTTAGSRRDVVAIDGMTGETLWMFRFDEGIRGDRAVRPQNRGLAYWTDGEGDERILLISPGFQLVALNAKDGHRIDDFGTDGVVDLTLGLDRDVVEPGQIGSSSPAIVINDVVVMGAALVPGGSPVSMKNVPGHIRGYDVRTGKKLWTFRTIPVVSRVCLQAEAINVTRCTSTAASSETTWEDLLGQHLRLGARNSDTSTSLRRCRPATSTADIVWATTYSRTALSASTQRPANACGTSRWCTTMSGTTISDLLRSWPT